MYRLDRQQQTTPTTEETVKVKRLFAIAKPTRAPLWRQVPAIAWLWWLYDAIANLTTNRRSEALRSAAAILRLETRFGLSVERTLIDWVAPRHWLALATSDFYDVAHLAVTFVVLGVLWFRGRPNYLELRNVLMLINVLGFIVFLVFPVAPPRMLPGFVDVVSSSHAIGSWHSGQLGSLANEYAAMPSLHIAWAGWCGFAVVRSFPNRVWAIVGALYLATTTMAVLSTGNHFVLDVFAGFLTLAMASAFVRGLSNLKQSIIMRRAC